MTSARSRPHPKHSRGFTLLELLVVIGIIALMTALVIPVVNGINGSRGMTRALNDVAGILELARAEAMATRTYVYVGFANVPTNAPLPGEASEIRIGAVASVDGSSNTTAANLRPISKLVKIPNTRMTDYAGLPQVVKAASDISLQTAGDYVTAFPVTDYLKDKFNDSAFDSCPTATVSPQGEILHFSNPTVFFRATTSVGLLSMRGSTVISSDGGIVSYYGGSGQLRITRPR